MSRALRPASFFLWILFCVFSAHGWAQQVQSVNYAETLTGARLNLTRIEQTLLRSDLSDAQLQSLRDDLDPILRASKEAITAVSANLSVVEARLEQLAPKTDDKVALEDESVKAERAQQKKMYESLDALLKQARLLAIDVDQMRDKIIARRRALFASAVFSRSYSIFDFGLWSSVLRETPSDVTSAFNIFLDWSKNAATQLSGMRGVFFFLLLGFVLFLHRFILRFSQRLLQPLFLDRFKPEAEENAHASFSWISENAALRRLSAAFWTLCITALPPIFTMILCVGILRFFGLIPLRLEPILHAIQESIVRIALTLAFGRALLEPAHPTLRLLDLSDRVSERLLRLAVWLSILISIGKFLETAYDVVSISFPLSVLTRALIASSVAVAMATGLKGILSVAQQDVAKTGRQDWYVFLRILAWVTLCLILMAVGTGYVSFATFVMEQISWVAFVITIFFLARELVGEGLKAILDPHAPIGHGVITSVGIRQESLKQTIALLSGILHLSLWLGAGLLILAPWGIESADMLSRFSTLLVGFKIGDFTISFTSIAMGFVLFGLFLALTKGLQNWLDQRFLPLTHLDTGLKNSIRTSLGYIGFTLACLIALQEIGMDFQKVALVAGALSVGIGFGLQSIVNNFVSGLIILWERAIRVGDWIVVGEEQGYVRRINVRSTEIETFDRATMIVPNSNLVGGVIKNWVRSDRIGRIKIPISVPLETDVALVRDTLIACARVSDIVLRTPSPYALLVQIATELKFELICYVSDVESSMRVKSDINFEILRQLKALNIQLIAPTPLLPIKLIHDGAEIFSLKKDLNNED